jgi:hypothetical protein
LTRTEAQESSARRHPAAPGLPAIDPADWTADELARADDWVFELEPSDIAEIDTAITSVEARGLDIMDIGVDDFPLPTLDAKLAGIKHQLMDGRGVALLRGLPVERLGAARTAMAFWGIGLRVGEPVSQNAKGHMLGHVADLVGSDIQTPSHRGYQTNATMHYHCDSCDLVVLLCKRQAKSGGVTSAASSVAIHNEIIRRRPDLARVLAGDWYRDRREEVPPDKNPWFVLPVFNYVDGQLVVNWQGQYIRSAQRFDDVPRFSDAQQEAMELLTSLAGEMSHGVRLDAGDTLFLHNHVVMHSRTEFEDFDEPDRKRHLFRLWLATPGGRPIPDAMLERYVGLAPGQRPSGIVVEATRLCTPLTPV